MPTSPCMFLYFHCFYKFTIILYHSCQMLLVQILTSPLVSLLVVSKQLATILLQWAQIPSTTTTWMCSWKEMQMVGWLLASPKTDEWYVASLPYMSIFTNTVYVRLRLIETTLLAIPKTSMILWVAAEDSLPHEIHQI